MHETGAAPSFAREAAGAARGLTALVRHDPDWSAGFDASARGFLRSFLAPVLALPFYLITAAMIARSTTPPGGAGALWGAGLSQLLDTIAYPLVVAAFARPLKIGGGFTAFIVVVNWASLFLNAILALSALAGFSGPRGYGVFSTAAVALFALSVFITWRAARETLTQELAPCLLMVVLSVAVGVACDQASTLLLKLWG